MTFTAREPGLEIMFLKHDPDSESALPIAAGILVRMVGDKLVDLMTDVTSQSPVGFLMQQIKDEYTDLPTFARFRSDLGSSDAFKGDPVGVASGGIWETSQYVDEGSDGITAGTLLYCDNDGKLSDTNADTVSTSNNAYGPAAMALNTLTSTQTTASTVLLIKALI